MRESQQCSSQEKEEARDSDPDVEVEGRQDFWSTVGNYMYRNHVAPRTKLCVPKHDFPTPLNYIGVQRHENLH